MPTITHCKIDPRKAGVAITKTKFLEDGAWYIDLNQKPKVILSGIIPIGLEVPIVHQSQMVAPDMSVPVATDDPNLSFIRELFTKNPPGTWVHVPTVELGPNETLSVELRKKIMTDFAEQFPDEWKAILAKLESLGGPLKL
jgi:hypothetical protein